MKKIILTSLVVATAVFAQNNYNQKANKISKELLKTLGGNLKKELKSNGPIAALKYCSTKAYDLTKSVSDKHGKNINIKRISLKPRNPSDAANKDETVILKSMEAMYKVGVQPKNITQKKDGKVIVYKPLIIKKKACLICHGDVAKNKPKLAKEIKNLYPADKATGYKMGDLRGAIVVTFEKKGQ